jgi:hypothetical protein
VHMLIQCGFTIALHMRPLTAKDAAPIIRWSTLALSLIVILLPQILNTRFSPIASSVHNEHIYRLFMAFYALIFPAYVWICMILARQPMSRARLIVLMAAVLIAAPMFWLGFMTPKMIWLIPGLAIVLAARFIVPAFEAGPAARSVPSGSRIANS